MDLRRSPAVSWLLTSPSVSVLSLFFFHSRTPAQNFSEGQNLFYLPYPSLPFADSFCSVIFPLLLSVYLPLSANCGFCTFLTNFLHGISTACYASYDRVIRLSVCLSVTRWHCVKITQTRITKYSPTDSPRNL